MSQNKQINQAVNEMRVAQLSLLQRLEDGQDRAQRELAKALAEQIDTSFARHGRRVLIAELASLAAVVVLAGVLVWRGW